MKKIYLLIIFLLQLSCYNGLNDMYDDVAGKVPICVDNVNGYNFNDGRGWKNAKQTIKAAFTVAEDGDEIWIAANGSNLFDFQINKRVKFYGGFNGTESREDDRGNNKTVINVSGSTNRIDINSYDILLDGFTITGTHACSAVQINSGYSVVFKDCNFSGNINNSSSGGSVIYCMAGRFALVDCYFYNNVISSGGINGGAIYCDGTTGSVKITGCWFENNSTTSGNGGAIYCDSSSSIEITETTFKSNTAGSNHYGGAIYSTSSTIKLTRCLFDANTASFSGGAIYSNDNNNLEIEGAIFNNNISSANYAGGIYSYNSKLNITNSIFNGNTAYSPGGAIYILGEDDGETPIVIVNSLFFNNKTNYINTFGGGIICSAFADTPVIYIANCTFYNNTGTSASSSGSLYMFSNATAYVYNSIFYNNSGTSSISDVAAYSYCYNNAWDSGENTLGGVPADTQILTGSPFSSVLETEPDFMHLSSGSVCIDAGTSEITIPGFTMPATDLAGNPRIAGGIIDIGCYESQ